MKVFYGQMFQNVALAQPKVALGTFDGVHLGHQELLRQLVAWARTTDSDAAVVTFDRKPRDALAGRTSDLITSLQHRLLLFERLGVDATLVLTFDEHLAACEPDAFVKDILVDGLHAAGVLLGHDTRFGREGRGNMELLCQLGKALGFETCSVPVVEVDDRPVSSTRIRQAIQRNDLATVERLLGRRMSLLGTVVGGTARGRKLGYPTANLDIHHEVQPPEGVYATRTLVNGVWRASVTNIGRAPTLQKEGPAYVSEKVIVETHLLDFTADLYGKDLEIEFVTFLRPEKVFPSGKTLAEQIAHDVEQARSLLATSGNAHTPETPGNS